MVETETDGMRRMDATRFAEGRTFTEFVTAAIQLKGLWEDAVKRLEVPEAMQRELHAMSGRWHCVGLTEDWCLDAVSTLTPIAKLLDGSGNIDLRVFARDENLDIMDAHLTDGGRSIPIVIVYDEAWVERGWWGPRPSELQRWVKTEGQVVTKEEKYRHIRGWYARDKGHTALREMMELLTVVSGGMKCEGAADRGGTANSEGVNPEGVHSGGVNPEVVHPANSTLPASVHVSGGSSAR